MKHIKKFSALLAVTATCAMALLTACGDDAKAPVSAGDSGTPDTASADTSTLQSGTVKGNITYTGEQRGAFYIALFTSISPSPTGLSGASAVFAPTLPGTSPYSVTNIPPGSYFISAYIAPAVQGQPPSPGPTTPLAPFTSVTVTSGGTTTQDLTVVDPPAGDAGDAGDAGEGGG